jgi:hypothetical protein
VNSFYLSFLFLLDHLPLLIFYYIFFLYSFLFFIISSAEACGLSSLDSTPSLSIHPIASHHSPPLPDSTDILPEMATAVFVKMLRYFQQSTCLTSESKSLYKGYIIVSSWNVWFETILIPLIVLSVWLRQ